MGDYFTKHHPPHHHMEIRATYLYFGNALIKIDHNIVLKWANAVLTIIYTVSITSIHTVAITPNHTILKRCANAVRTEGQTSTKTVM